MCVIARLHGCMFPFAIPMAARMRVYTIRSPSSKYGFIRVSPQWPAPAPSSPTHRPAGEPHAGWHLCCLGPWASAIPPLLPSGCPSRWGGPPPLPSPPLGRWARIAPGHRHVEPVPVVPWDSNDRCSRQQESWSGWHRCPPVLVANSSPAPPPVSRLFCRPRAMLPLQASRWESATARTNTRSRRCGAPISAAARKIGSRSA